MLTSADILRQRLHEASSDFHPVLPLDMNKDRAEPVDLSFDNPQLQESLFGDTQRFTQYLDGLRQKAGARYLYGGYAENRPMYARSSLFDQMPTGGNLDAESRTLHLGIDIWGDAGTEIFAPLGGSIHSLGYHPEKGNYGGTLIVSHQLEGLGFYALYGHLSRNSLSLHREGQFINRGELLGWLGNPAENGDWPPHLHYQLILDIGVYDGDYPGVCKASEAETWLLNSPDPVLFFPFIEKYR